MNGKKLLVLTGIVLLAWAGSVWAADLKIGCVDIQKIANESSVGKEAKTSFDKEVDRVQRLDADKQREIRNLQESLEKQSSMLTLEARVTRQKDIQNKVREYQRWKEDTDNDLNLRSQDVERKLALDLKKVADKIGAEEGFTLILVNSQVLYSSKAIDITDRVIKALDMGKK